MSKERLYQIDVLYPGGEPMVLDWDAFTKLRQIKKDLDLYNDFDALVHMVKTMPQELPPLCIMALARLNEKFIFRGMISRCYNQKDANYKNYGGRGIYICERWGAGSKDPKYFGIFLADKGLRPSRKHSIDRYPDNDGPYSPENTRWATRIEQNNNKRLPIRPIRLGSGEWHSLHTNTAGYFSRR